MTATISKCELERLQRIERLAREAIKPNPQEKHRAALAALRDALTEKGPASDNDVRRGAVTLRVIEQDE